MKLIAQLAESVSQGIMSLYGQEFPVSDVRIQETSADFEGEFTVVIFPMTRLKVGSPQEIGERLGQYLVDHFEAVAGFNVVKGFLNLSLSEQFWKGFMKEMNPTTYLASEMGKGKSVVIEYSSPNTNKPLHLGHLRNNFLGYSISQIMRACGYDVHEVCLVNDRGIAICKSMLMYAKFGKGQTPQENGKKPDFFVVDFYTRFGDENKVQALELAAETGKTVEEVENNTPLMEEAREMLRLWEAGDPETLALWKKMNDWVYEGFDETYKRIGVHFEKTYYESDTWTEGSKLVDEGLAKGIFYKKDDGSVWFDLSKHGLDDKAVRRSDGTSMYITQDLGTARQKYLDYKMDQSIFVVGNEQDHHFKVLFLMLNALDGFPVEGLFHLSYAMVDLPGGQGRIKTREGTRVDADNLMDEVCKKALEVTSSSQRLEGFSEGDVNEIVEKVGLAALKYYVLKVNPKRRMIFDPEESVDLHGNTGPFIQYAWARTRSVWEKAIESGMDASVEKATAYSGLLDAEKKLLRNLFKFPSALEESSQTMDPSVIANLCYDVAKNINSVWHEAKILNEEDLAATGFRLALLGATREVLKQALELLGIHVPQRM